VSTAASVLRSLLPRVAGRLAPDGEPVRERPGVADAAHAELVALAPERACRTSRHVRDSIERWLRVRLERDLQPEHRGMCCAADVLDRLRELPGIGQRLLGLLEPAGGEQHVAQLDQNAYTREGALRQDPGRLSAELRGGEKGASGDSQVTGMGEAFGPAAADLLSPR